MKSHCDINFIGPGIIRAFCLTCVLLTGNVFFSQAQERENAVYANIIYRFTKYIDWPDDKKSGNFVIGVLGDFTLYDELTTFVANKAVGEQKIVIKKLHTSSVVSDCHILFIGEDESSNIKKILVRTSGMSVLLVSESAGLARKGSCINFVISDDRLKLEINKANIEHRRLSIATELLSLGKVVN